MLSRFRVLKTPLIKRFGPISSFHTSARLFGEKETEKQAPEAPVVEESKIDERDLKFKELQDSYRRALADQENLRERSRRDVQAASDFAIQKFAKDLLDVADVLEMAVNSVPEELHNNPENPHLRDLFQGLKVTQAELQTIFRRHGIEVFDPINEKFDPNFHNALFQVPIEEKDPDVVMIVQKKGYKLKGRVLRAANVGVSKKP